MLIVRRRGGLDLVTQGEHARLAGDLAAAWGNAAFAGPARREGLLLAARRHDDGWRSSDDTPAFDAARARPLHFLELGLAELMALYEPGVRAVQADDPYAGLLVSMHWIGLLHGRWGLEGAAPAALAAQAGELRLAEEARWARARLDAWDGAGPRSAFEAGLWHDYDLLQAVDQLSLALCTMDPDVPADPGRAPVRVSATLAEIEHDRAVRIVAGAPTGPARSHVDLAVTVADRGVARVEPWPLRDECSVEIAIRRIPDRTYASAHDAARAWADADVRRVDWRLVGPGS